MNDKDRPEAALESSGEEALLESVARPADNPEYGAQPFGDLPERLPRDAEGLNELAKQLDVRKLDLLVLGKEVDPFNTGTAAKVGWADWFAEIWERFGFTSGVHIRRVHYRAQATGDVLLPDGEVYLNTYDHWRKLAPASNHARDLGRVDSSLFADRRNPAIVTYARGREEVPIPDWEVTLEESSPWSLPTLSGWDRPHFNAYRLPPLEFFSGSLNPHRTGHVDVSGYDYRTVDQPYYEVLWIEKSTMDDVLDPLCSSLGVDFAPGKGFTSKTRTLEVLLKAREHGKPLRVFTISDFDPGGSHMATAISRHLEYYRDAYAAEVEIVVRHLGMDAEWVGKYDLPRAPIEPGKTAVAQGRIDNFETLHGEGAVELDALEALHPGALDREVRDLIYSYRDADLRDKLDDARGAAQRHVSAAWRATTADVRDEMVRISAEIGGLVDGYRPRLAEVQNRRDELMAPFLERLRGLEAEAVEALQPIRDDYVRIAEEFEADTESYGDRLVGLWGELQDLADGTDMELPDRPIPVVDVDEDGVLFDSRRHWWDQLHRYREEQGRGPVYRNTHTKQSRSEHNLTCEGCGKAFTARRRDARACGNTCRKRMAYRQKNGGDGQ